MSPLAVDMQVCENMKFRSGLSFLLIILLGVFNGCSAKDANRNDTKAAKGYGDDQARGRAISAVVDVVPTYTFEYRSPNRKDIKFTSGGIYQTSVLQSSLLGLQVNCDLKMGVYAHDSKSQVQFIITRGNEGGAFHVNARRVKDFFFMDINTNKHLNRESIGNYLLTVVAQDPRTKLTLDRTEVNISVIDTNDNRPIFFNATQFVTVDEDIPLHTSIAKVVATDADIGPNGWLYFSFKDKTSSFAIDPISGVVSVTRKLDGARRKNYNLRVVAKDRALPPSKPTSSRNHNIIVTVNPVNRYSPKIKIKSQLERITEGATGMQFAVIRVTDQDYADNGEISKVRITSGNEDGCFKLKRSDDTENEFVIDVVKPLDREKTPNGIDLVLVAFDKGIPPRNGTATLHVVLDDVNDMKPAFNQSKYVAKISEFAPPHSSVIQVTAVDGDFGDNGKFHYMLSKGSDMFEIDTITGLITTKSNLDYETKPRFELEVTTVDGGKVESKQIATVKVSVEVEDANDHDPVFDQPSSSIDLYEDLTPGTEVLTVTAKDRDSGENGQIQYIIANTEPVPFVIDSQTGDIKTLTTLDRDTGLPEFITLKVRASDFGKPLRRESETFIHFRIKALNDNPPVFKQYRCNVQISPDVSVGTEITTLTAVDIDVGKSKALTYRIESVGNTLNTFEIDSDSGVLKTAKSLPRGTRVFSLHVTVTDGIQQSQYPVTLKIRVVPSQDQDFVKTDCTDFPDYYTALQRIQDQGDFKPSKASIDQASPKPKNSFRPVFEAHRPVINISEDVAVRTSLIKLTAEDQDQGYNGMVVYSIASGNTGSSFNIDMRTGDIYVVTPLDRETTAHYMLNISAADCGRRRKTAFTSIKISVVDVNDNSPVFEKESYEVQLLENITRGQTVVVVKATDLDDSDNGRVTYQLANDFGGKFRIDSVSGRLAVASSLDFEETARYDIEVQALDGSADLQRMTSVFVHLKLIDVNDNAPVIVPGVFNISIPEDIPVESAIATVCASDPDTGNGGKLSFSLVNSPKKFKIDSESGVLRLRRRVDYEQQNVYNVTVNVSDKGIPSLTSYALITVNIVDVNENNIAPRFKEGDLLKTPVYENMAAGTTVVRVTATDDDSWYLKYAIIDGTGVDKFNIDPDTGAITTTQVLDREDADHYWLTVQAKDGEIYPLHTNIPVLISILDMNDEPPFFNPPVYYPSVRENAPRGESVVSLEAHDPNSDGSNLRYTITKGNEANKFALDSKTGLVTTTTALDREDRDNYILTVKVSNGGTPPKVASITFTITVTDENDNEPYFLETSYSGAIIEQGASSDPVEIFRVIAVDEDIGTNADLTYRITSGNEEGKLSIDPKTGVITSRQALHDGDVFDLLVNVTDGGVPQKYADTSVSLDVISKNPSSSSPPQFGKKVYKSSVQEDTDVGFMVLSVDADDPDMDILSFSIISGNVGNKFQIDQEYGEITVAGKLDREQQKSYNLTVVASDDHNVGIATVIVNIMDVNDNSPRPAMTEYQAHISEDARPGTRVITVEATDPDEGLRGDVVYSIVGSVKPKSHSLFKIQSSTGKIKTTKALDYEDMKQHILIIKASDQGIPKRESLFSVVISVDDVNDHKPVFLRPLYKCEVKVDTAPGTSVIKVFASDGDDGTNALLKFAINSGNPNDAFYVDQNSGIIQVATKLSSAIEEYNLQVSVSDSGNPAKTAKTEVKIFVKGIKKPFAFERPLYEATIAENVRAGHSIVSVVFNGSLSSYEIVPQDSACWREFDINRQSGVVTNKVPFDAEELSECKLKVRANSSNGDWDETQVIVKILDKNDNPPKFAHARYVGHVTEGLVVDSPVIGGDGKALVVQATDADITASQLLFEVLGCSAFSIDHESGALVTAEVLDFEQFPSYKFKIKVSDSGAPSLVAFVNVEVFVEDINDLPPVFVSPVFNAIVYLPTFPSTEVVQISAMDGDSSSLTALTYSLGPPPLANIFEISSELDVITVKNASSLQEAFYHFKVAVSDGNFSDYATVNIDCKPLPVSDLKFSQANYTTSVVEGVTSEKEIAAVRAIGYSVGETITFSIVTPSDFFVISPSTGAVSTLPGKEFDRETVDRYEVVVQARDDRKSPRIAQTVVYVTVEDVNDNMPEFTEESYFFVVQVGRDIGAFVGSVNAVDKDIGSNGAIKYTLMGGDEGRFRVEHTTGDIKVRRLLDDVVVPRVYTLQIEAHDKGRARLSATTIVKLKVVDKETPIFDQLSYSKVVREDVKVGVQITRVQARSPGGADIFYTIMQGDPLNQFSIDLKSGEVTVVAPLDYETFTQYQLTVRATDAKTTSFGEITVEVIVSDVNDIAPVFNQSLYLAKISEVTPIGTSVISVKAFDADSGINKYLTYRLETSNLNNNNTKVSEFFVINQTNSVISVAKELDYESHVVHELKVIATDGGQPPLTGEARVRVVVVDANDNPPRFEQDDYATSISGSAGPGYFVTRVIATDPDESDVGKLRYTISSGEGREHFRVNPQSGVLTIARMIGLERGKVYDLGVEVTDGKSTAKTNVRVVIGDTNDHSPVFDQETYAVDFHENYPEGTFVTMVTATDEDSGEYARVYYSIDSLEAAEKFTVDADTGMIYSRLAFDRENSSHAFTSVPIRATDGGGRFGFCTVEVRILDENDNQPKFELPQYEVTVPLTVAVGAPVLVTSANDEDTGSNSALTYAILGHQTPPVFEIEVDTGIIKVSQQPEEKTYKFYVLVKDGGNPQLRNMVLVSVNVLRKGAKILQFERSEYKVNLPEDTKAGYLLTTVRTKFPGSAKPPVQFKIIPGNSPSSRGEKFRIGSGGQIYLKSSVDYETIKRYVLIVEANASSIAQVARSVVVVLVKDVNDNRPHFVANPYRVSVPENINVGSKVLRVFAEDLDSSKNGQVLYDFTHQKDSKFFAVDQQTGWITTIAELDREVTNSLVLSVRATDRGKVTQLSGHTAVHVTVLDVNDSPPKFASDLFEFSVREDALIGQEVGTLVANDKDLNSDVFFFIMSGDPQTRFGIEQKTGKVFVHSSLDRETVAFYKLNVSASDGLFTSFATLNITVLDANDNPPVCTQSISIVHVREDVKPGYEVLVVEATDTDAEDDGKLKYSVYGQGIGVFEVENGTGRLLTFSSLDRETQDMYNFMVSAEDRGGQACFSNVTVLLDDVNDNPPRFTQPQYMASVYEDARVNKVLLQVKADDSDIGKNRKISFSLLDTDGGDFSIDSETGIITLKKTLNREKIASYKLTVRARDEGVPQLNDTCAVVIQVLNVNDVPPEFTESSYKANVSEDAAKGTTVATMTAISKEAGHEELSYEILKGPDSNMFRIDRKTGAVTLQGVLDFETRKSYSLTVQASDVGPPVLSATATLNIMVDDANDHTPSFAKALHTAKVDENAPADTFVLQLFATDQDSGSNGDIRYSVVKGNEAGSFKIDQITGVISVAAPVDYETASKFTLTVQAQDQGNSPLTTVTEVRVSVTDLNDNPPEFTNTNFTATVSESAPIGTTVIYLRPHDRDGHGNGSPFKFMTLMGDQTKFKLHSDGQITTAGPLDHRDGNQLYKFRVFDNGEPPQFTDKTVTIEVAESITHAPVVEPLTVYLNLYGSQFNGGVVGSLKGSDLDGDPLIYSLTVPGSPFTITPDGLISATSNVLSRIYNLNVSVTDGKYRIHAPVQIVVSDITEDILVHSLTLRLSDLGPGTFVEKNLGKCRDYLAGLLKVSPMNVHIWSLQSSDTSLDVVFAVMKRLKGFFDSQHIANKLNATRGDFERAVDARVAYIGVSQCRLMHCPDNYKCQAVYKPENKQIRIMSDQTTYISYEHSRSHTCMCVREGACVGPVGKCVSSPCPIGYKCYDVPQGFQCKRFDAPGCEDKSCITGDKSSTFNGDAYIRYRLKEAFDKSSRSISLALKTTEPQGTLMYAAGQYDYSILEIVNGRLELRFDFGSGAGLVNLDWARVDDGKWHHVKVMRQGNHATLILDQGRHRAWNQSPGKMRVLNLDDDSIYFGAKVVGSMSRRDVSSLGRRVENGFKGCLQNINLNGQDLPMTGSNSHVTAQPHKAVPGCRSSGACLPNTCPRNSMCVGTPTSPECKCLRGHSGPDCRPTIGCDEKPCLNGGSCFPDAVELYRCKCVPGYGGTQCHIYLGRCVDSPCQNGGICNPAANNGFTCACPEGLSGLTCERDTRPCASNPCAFNTNCTNLGDDYQCHCTAGLTGKRCAEGYDCNRLPCKNGGSCSGKGLCVCPQGYKGADCSEHLNACDSSPCKNGGVCKNTDSGFICNCSTSTHGGKLCDQVLAAVEARRGWPLGQNEIIGIAVVLVVLILIVFLVIIFLRRRAKRRREMRARSGPAKTVVLKVSPPVAGSDVASPEPPTPPPREIHGYNVEELIMPPGYDSEDSWRRRERARKDFGTMKTLNGSDNNLPGYHWDYTDIPADLVPSGSLSKGHSASYVSEGATFVPEVPQRPSSLRSSQGSLDVPEVPKRPRNYKVSESEDGYHDVPHVPRKPVEYLHTKGKSPSRYSMDSRFSEISDATDLDPDIFKGRFPGPPREPYPESLDQHPVGSYAPTLLTTRESELGSITDGLYSEDDLEQVYLGNRLETCDDSPENSYLHSENCSEDEDEDEDGYACGKDPCRPEDPEFHQALQREIREMMDELEDLKMESEL